VVAEKIFKLCRVLVMVAGPGSLYMRAFDHYEGLGGCWCCGSEYVALLLQIPSKGHLAVFLGGGGGSPNLSGRASSVTPRVYSRL
jgi:hypothetical protein